SGRRVRAAATGRAQRLLQFRRREWTDVVSVRTGGTTGWPGSEYQVIPGWQSVRAVFAAIVGRSRAAAGRRAQRALAGDSVEPESQHTHAHTRHRPSARITHGAGNHSATRNRDREIADRFAVLDDNGRAGAFWTGGAITAAQIPGLECLHFEA